VLRFIRTNQLLVFFALTFVVIGTAAFLGHRTQNEMLVLPGVLGPTIVAALLVACLEGTAGLKSLFVDQMRFGFSPFWYLITLLMIPAVVVVAITLGSILLNQEVVLGQPSVFPQIIFVIIISLGEEFGWRGYALPRLQQRYSALDSSLILGLLWSFWHFPGYLIGTGVPLDMPFYLFMLWVIPATILMTWVYNNTSSVFAAILFHSSANMSFGLRLLPEQTGERTTFAVFVALVWLCAIVVTVVYGPRHLRKR